MVESDLLYLYLLGIAMASSSTGEDALYCGPEDPSVLYLQPHHITESIISENDTDTFQPRKLDNNIFKAPMHDRVLGHIERMGFGGVYHCGKPKMLDASLIGALIERWRPETHTFHLPVGEATVTLQDIEVLWGLRVDGEPVILPQVNHPREYWMDTCLSLLGIAPSQAELKLGGFNATTLKDAVSHRLDDDLPEHYYMQYARIFVLLLLGCLIIPDTSGRKIPFHHILLLVDEDQSSQLSWGAAALATLYHYLCEASCQKRKDIGGPLALLQMWAWERIPNIRPEIVDRVEYDGTTPRAIM